MIRRESISSPAATRLIGALNAELSRLYPEEGTAEHFRLTADEVAAGRGAFLVAYLDDEPLGCGAVRLLDDATAEIKRMFVVPHARARGVGRRLLAELEAQARALGATAIVLESGPRQPEAVALFRSAGFADIPAFGDHVSSPLSVFMAKELR